jgi:hypothetical protein
MGHRTHGGTGLRTADLIPGTMPPPRPGTGPGRPGAGLEADVSGDERGLGGKTSAREPMLRPGPFGSMILIWSLIGDRG